MTALVGKKSDIYITSGAAVAYPANDPMTDISANVPLAAARTCYSVTAAARRYADPNQAIVYQISLNSGGSWATTVPDIITPGFIQYNASQQSAPAAMFRVLSGFYLPFSRVGGGNEWSLSPSMDIYDATEFMQTSKHHVTGLTAYAVNLKRFWLDDSVRALNGSQFVLILYIDATSQPAGPRYELRATMKGDQVKTPVHGTIDESIDFDAEGDAALLSA